jgi:hypothetical protein
VRSFFETRIINKRQPVRTDAFVRIFGPANEDLGYGPAADPNGVFAGRSDIVFADKWWFDPYSRLTLAEFPGGRFIPSGPAGSYTITWNLLHSNTGVVERGTKSITL